MRKIIVTTTISLDGIMQAPGGPKEDTSGGFQYGGWAEPFGDEVFGKAFAKEFEPKDYLLGRKTFEIFAGYWPQHADIWPSVNENTKYVFSETMTKSDLPAGRQGWKNTEFVKTLDDIKKIKESEGLDIQVWGSSELVHLLLKEGLVDELWLKILPVILGTGKRLFDDGIVPGTFKLTDNTVTPKGVIMTYYERVGEVKTGTI
jgi:dihydrofolate reductase